MTPLRLRLGTRRSRLAVAQSTSVAERLRARGHEVELVLIDSRGDRAVDVPFEQIGAPGVFVRELERALAEGAVDLVVHSYKDLPSAAPPDLVLAAVPEREDPADRLIIRPGSVAASDDSLPDDLLPLPTGARVGTASARRAALLASLRPDLEVAHLRGNVPTRLDRLRAGAYDAIVLAAAGLDRLAADGLALDDLVDHRLDPSIFVPAPSQGALALQVRDGNAPADRAIRDAVAALDDPSLAPALTAERSLQARIEGGCHTAFGAWCRRDPSGALRLDAVLGVGDGQSADGRRAGLRRAAATGDDPLALAEAAARELLAPLDGERA